MNTLLGDRDRAAMSQMGWIVVMALVALAVLILLATIFPGFVRNMNADALFSSFVDPLIKRIPFISDIPSPF